MNRIILIGLLLISFCGTLYSQKTFFTKKNADYGIAIGAWLGGEVSLADLGMDIDKEVGFLLQSFIDFYLIEKLAFGVYANYSSLSFDDVDNTASMYEFGIAIKPRFILGTGSTAIKPGLQLGYRVESTDISGVDDVSAFGLNLSVEFQFNVKSNIMPFGVIGFLSQPAGGNDDTDVTFAPIFYLGGGVVF
ncbi:MAG: hypothetical protein IPM56_01485 [Ignavibacteriales bacterium]|nr:MAG: hypothetical protein IPM56_01485 [Ignavibacteriales bacterium]